MKSTLLKLSAIVLILVTGYLHFITTPHEYSEARYMGILFLLNAVAALISAVGILRSRFLWGWALGFLIAAGSILGYLQSRTIGMPGMEAEEWFDPIGIPAVIVEAGYLIVFALARPWIDSNSPTEASPEAQNNGGRRLIVLNAALAGMVAFSLVSVPLGLGGTSRSGEHTIPDTVITAQRLEEEYGIRLTLVAVTAAGGMVDVRYRIIDPEKASQLVDPDDGGIMPMLHVQDELCTDTGPYAQYAEILLMPDSHMRTQQLVADRMYFTLIPNTRGVVRRGTSVMVVFGDVAIEPLPAR